MESTLVTPEQRSAPVRNGVTREMYLVSSDAAAEVGVPVNVLTHMAKEIRVGSRRGCVAVFTAGEIAKLRNLKTFMDELEAPPSLAAKVIKMIEKRKRAAATADSVGLADRSPSG